jgi:hypothetical protein
MDNLEKHKLINVDDEIKHLMQMDEVSSENFINELDMTIDLNKSL